MQVASIRLRRVNKVGCFELFFRIFRVRSLYAWNPVPNWVIFSSHTKVFKAPDWLLPYLVAERKRFCEYRWTVVWSSWNSGIFRTVRYDHYSVESMDLSTLELQDVVSLVAPSRVCGCEYMHVLVLIRLSFLLPSFTRMLFYDYVFP